MMRISCMLLAVLIVTPVYGEPSQRRVRREAPACQGLDEFDRIVRLAADGDDKAAVKALASGILTGQCTVLKPGQLVYLESVKPLFRRIKVRPQGEPSGVWTYSGAVE